LADRLLLLPALGARISLAHAPAQIGAQPQVCSAVWAQSFRRSKRSLADAGHQSRKLTRLIKAEGYELRIVKRRKQAFEVVGLTWIVERTFAWIGMSKDYEHRVQTSGTLIGLIAVGLMLNRLIKS
jgi:transposase